VQYGGRRLSRRPPARKAGPEGGEGRSSSRGGPAQSSSCRRTAAEIPPPIIAKNPTKLGRQRSSPAVPRAADRIGEIRTRPIFRSAISDYCRAWRTWLTAFAPGSAPSNRRGSMLKKNGRRQLPAARICAPNRIRGGRADASGASKGKRIRGRRGFVLNGYCQMPGRPFRPKLYAAGQGWDCVNPRPCQHGLIGYERRGSAFLSGASRESMSYRSPGVPWLRAWYHHETPRCRCPSALTCPMIGTGRRCRPAGALLLQVSRRAASAASVPDPRPRRSTGTDYQARRPIALVKRLRHDRKPPEGLANIAEILRGSNGLDGIYIGVGRPLAIVARQSRPRQEDIDPTVEAAIEDMLRHLSGHRGFDRRPHRAPIPSTPGAWSRRRLQPSVYPGASDAKALTIQAKIMGRTGVRRAGRSKKVPSNRLLRLGVGRVALQN